MIASNNILAFIGSYSMLYSSVLGASSPSALFSASCCSIFTSIGVKSLMPLLIYRLYQLINFLMSLG